MVLLLLLTGLETDLRLLRNLGKAALIASGMGMVIPFATGLGLGFFMPDSYLADPDQRVLFSFFLATAMAISAMPVIAKILMDLDLTKRNIGLVILSAGVVDDTAGWLDPVGHRRRGVDAASCSWPGSLDHGRCIMVGFIWPRPGSCSTRSRAGPWAWSSDRHFRPADADLVLVLVITFTCAAATEWIGIHAVFGAFIAGTMFRQVPQLRTGDRRTSSSRSCSRCWRRSSSASSGCKVDLWALGGGSMLGIVLAVACLGKLVGCTRGQHLGRAALLGGASRSRSP